MRYRVKVLAQVPNAVPVVIRRWPDGEPKHVSIYRGANGHQRLDIHDAPEDGWGGRQQLHAAAWRSAYYWLVRNKRAAA